MRFLSWKLFFAAVLLFVMCVQVQAHPNSEAVAASALFERFETVFYADREIVSASGAYKALSERESLTLHYPFARLQGALNSLGDHTSVEIFENGKAVLVGARDFHGPVGLGRVRSELCYIVVLRNDSRFELRSRFKESPSSSAAGSPVWSWSAKLGEFGEDDPRPSSLFAAQVAQSYLLVSNSLEDLQNVAERLIPSGQDVQVLTNLRDWEAVRVHQFWGYRRYRHTEAVDPMAAGMSEVTPGAEALTFFVDFEKRLGVLRLFGSATDEGSAAKINARGLLPRLKQASPGIWETQTELSGDEKSFERMFAVMTWFGFGIYV